MTIAPIVRTVTVKVPPERAFQLFTGHMGKWWPAAHHIGKQAFVAIDIEPKVGGRWFERAADGTECPWGKVLEWGPPHRVVLGWQLNAQFEYDPDFCNEVELTFEAISGEAQDGGTLVTLTHHNIHRFGEGAAQLAEGMNQGWAEIIGSYQALADGEG